MLRSVVYKFTAEHTMSTAASVLGSRNAASKVEAADLVKAAENLYYHLHNGFTGVGVHRVPINGDTTRLPLAVGLSPLEKKLAWAQHFLAKNLAGSQQLRQVMGHRQFGARVMYGDCLFFTISPNEQHSALVLRLSRFRKQDPYCQHGDETRRKLARADQPPLEAQRKHSSQDAPPGQAHPLEDDVSMELPEYDLRKAATARDPLAVVEGFKIHVYFRLAILLGLRMCPQCPRCNHEPHGGCTDKFGNNMRPGGGISQEELWQQVLEASIKATAHPTFMDRSI